MRTYSRSRGLQPQCGADLVATELARLSCVSIALMPPKLHQIAIPTEVLQRGFWLYVWQVSLRDGTAVYSYRGG